jgi:radical SAM-linked protein
VKLTGLPVSFTGGFHPLPRLQVALPLPLGVEGTGEWLDLEFTEAVEPALVRARLQPELPPGLQLLSAAVVPTFGPSLSQELASAHWELDLRGGGPLSWQRLLNGVAAIRAAEVLLWHDTDKKGRPRQRDCRPALLALEPLPALSPPATAVEVVRLRLDAAVDEAGRSLRPDQVRHWLAEQLAEPLQLGRQCRLALKLRQPADGAG